MPPLILCLCRCWRCANESNPPGFLIGILCSTTIYSLYRSWRSFRSSSRTGARKTSPETCGLSRTVMGDGTDDTPLALQRPATCSFSRSPSRELPPLAFLTPPPGVFESRAARRIGLSYTISCWSRVAHPRPAWLAL